MLKHTVLITFKADLSPAKRHEAVDRFFNLPKVIPEVMSMEHGMNVSTEELHQGFTHCFQLLFADDKARDRYLAHPAHKEFVGYIVPLCSNALVVDFAAERSFTPSALKMTAI